MTSDDTFALLARENPVEELLSPHSPEARALRERVLLAEPLLSRADRSRRRPRRLLVLATTAATVVVASLVTLPRLLPEEHIGASPAAAAVLERAAVAATASPVVPAGHYAYTKAETLYAATRADAPEYSVLLPSVRETWVAADGSGRVVERPGEPIFLGGRDRARWLAAGSPPLAGSTEPTDHLVRAQYRPVSPALLARDPETLDLELLDRLLSAVPQLPTDPDRLGRIIRAYAEKKDPPFEAQMFNEVSGIVNNPYASAELRAAAYRVLARIDGVELGGRRRDAAGRLGTAISAPAGYGGPNRSTADPADSTPNTEESRRLIIDPRTGNVLAEETVLTKRVAWIDGDPGDTTGSITILEQGWVETLDQRPTGGG
jgi:hypothetical protein